ERHRAQEADVRAEGTGDQPHIPQWDLPADRATVLQQPDARRRDLRHDRSADAHDDPRRQRAARDVAQPAGPAPHAVPWVVDGAETGGPEAPGAGVLQYGF